MEALKSPFSILPVQSSRALCVQAGGVEKEKKAETEERAGGSAASGRYQPPTGWMAGSGDFGPGPLAVWARAQGFS